MRSEHPPILWEPSDRNDQAAGSNPHLTGLGRKVPAMARPLRVEYEALQYAAEGAQAPKCAPDRQSARRRCRPYTTWQQAADTPHPLTRRVKGGGVTSCLDGSGLEAPPTGHAHHGLSASPAWRSGTEPRRRCGDPRIWRISRERSALEASLGVKAATGARGHRPALPPASSGVPGSSTSEEVA
jgi:hypothetical protein